MNALRNDLGLVVLLVAGLAFVPLFVPNAYVLNVLVLCMIFAVFAGSWNLLSGVTGIFSFGHQAFFGLGAYVSALLAMHCSLDPLLCMLLAGLAAAAAGLVVGLPVLRLRAVPYVAIVTLAFAEILRIVTSNLTDLTRGELGLWGIPALRPVGNVHFDGSSAAPGYYAALVLFAVATLALGSVMRSRFGLALKAIRDNQDAAESLGVNLARHKQMSFAISAFIAGVAGAFYAHQIRILTPSSVLAPDLMVAVIAIVLVGGRGTLFGPILGAFLLTGGLEAMRGFSSYRMFVYGGLLLASVALLQDGLVGAFRALRSRLIGTAAKAEAPVEIL